jgi:hypothetical protein
VRASLVNAPVVQRSHRSLVSRASAAPDGKLCILDWGLVTTVRPDLQLTLIEHVAQ